MNKISLRAQNIAPLSVLTVIQLSVVYMLGFGINGLNELSSLAQAGGGVLAIGVIVGWFSHAIPANIKNSVVFLRMQNVLPGHRFIQLSESDPRIDITKLQKNIATYNLLRSAPKQQNAYWYGEIYRHVQNNREVVSIHRSFLLYRDAAAVSLMCAIFFVGTKIVFPDYTSAFGYGYVLVFLISLLGFISAANNTGQRLVTTAVAVNLC